MILDQSTDETQMYFTNAFKHELATCFIKLLLTFYSIIAPFDAFDMTYLKIVWKMEHLLFWSKCSIFHNIFKSIQNLP